MEYAKKETVNDIEYLKPSVYVLHDTGIAQAEIAGRTAYDSFNSSEHETIKEFKNSTKTLDTTKQNDIPGSELLSSLAWVHHHHSVIEHSSITYLIKGISRGVLQELVRHRIASYTVTSSRYTMGSIINAYTASLRSNTPKEWFVDKMHELDILITTDKEYNKIEYESIYNKLLHQEAQHIKSKENWTKLTVSKSSLPFLEEQLHTANELFEKLEAGKSKRNIGDPFKHIVTDNWKTDLVMTINLRSLKNFFDLRDSGAAWFAIQWLSAIMKEVTPKKYLKLIDKKEKDK